jgi:predicted enzyme related to lactoylglutathione lyase
MSHVAENQPDGTPTWSARWGSTVRCSAGSSRWGLPEFDFTFLRRPDGHEIGGLFGLPDAPRSAWATTFEVADTDAMVARAAAAGGTAGAPDDFLYGRMATITDPFGAEFSVIARPPGRPS